MTLAESLLTLLLCTRLVLGFGRILPTNECYKWPFKADSSTPELRMSVLESGYHTTLSPPANQQNFVDVKVTLVIEEMGPLDDMNEQIDATAMLSFKWTDERLKMDTNCLENLNLTEESRCGHEFSDVYKVSDIEDILWIPPVKILKLKEISERDLLLSQQQAYVNGCSGDVVIKGSVKFTVSCDMNFVWYPFDWQSCHLSLLVPQFNKEFEKVRLLWNVKPSMMLNKFRSNSDTSGNWEMSAYYEERKTTCQRCENFVSVLFRFKRSHIGYIVQIFLPTTFIVVASFGSLFVPMDQIPGRMTLAITTTLTLIAMTNNVVDKSPKTAYIKVMDIWLTSCFGFTFLVLVEFCAVIKLSSSTSRVSDVKGREERKGEKYLKTASFLEKWAKLCLPLTFFVAVLVFFIVVMHGPSFIEREDMTIEPIHMMQMFM